MPQSLDEIDFFDPAILADPHDYYQRLRTEAPVHKVSKKDGGPDFYLVTTFELATKVMENADLFSSRFGAILFGGAGGYPEADAIMATGWPQVETMLTCDNPDHQRFRGLVNSAFTPGRVAKMVPGLEQIVDQLIDNFITRGECDFVEDFAVQLPIYAIGDVLGLDRALYPRVKAWSDAFIMRLSQMGSREQEIDAATLIVDFQNFFHGLIVDRRAEPRDDLISDLIRARMDGVKPLEDVEILSILQQIAVAGNETTRNTLIGGLAIILQDKTQYAELLADPSLYGTAIEDILRLLAPTTGMFRIVTRETELGGVTIPKGATVFVRFDAANRDEKKFPDGQKFDIHRKNAISHMSFGLGIHHCLGAMLSRKELNIAFPKLLTRMKNARIVMERSDLSVLPSILHFAQRKLTVAFDPGPKVLG